MKLIIASKADTGHFRAGRKWEGPREVTVKKSEGMSTEDIKAFSKNNPDTILDTDLPALNADKRLIIINATVPDAAIKAETRVVTERAIAVDKEKELAAKREAGEKARKVEQRKAGR